MNIARLRNWSVGAKLTVFTFTLIVSIFMAVLFVIGRSTSNILEQQAIGSVAADVQGIFNTIEMFNRAELATIEKFSRIFSSRFPGKFSVDTQRQVVTGGTSAPVLRYDGADLNGDFSAVDKFTEMTGANATVFVKKGEDFVRVSTSVKKADGTRAVGTFLGHGHPGYAALMQGQTYKGLAVLFGRPHVTEYVPIKDEKQDVIGILYVGVDISAEVAILKEKIKALKIGSSGYVAVLNAKEGDTYGSFIVHPVMEGQKGLAQRDANGWEFVKDMLRLKQGTLRYTSTEQQAGKTVQREKLVVYLTNKEWNWVIAGVAFTDEITHEMNALHLFSVVIGIVALLAFAAALFFVVRTLVSKPLKTATDTANQLAKGDLTTQVAVTNQDEIGQLLEAMNGISAGLTKVVTAIREGTERVADASSQIAAENLDLSSRTEQQASSLEETAASLDEITSTVKQNADSARQANALATSASDIAVKGGDVVAQVVDTMNSISASSRRIEDIISVIDGIAFQTNILALNAAVEAARAGEQGRGFAVVASEVRNLAQRSAAAAKEIKTLIEDSARQVGAGSKLVTEAGATMREIVQSVHRVTGIIGEISAASEEQSVGIEQVSEAIGRMDQVTQQNAALVEKAATATKAMQEQAAKLAQVASTFKTDDSKLAGEYRNASHAGECLPRS